MEIERLRCASARWSASSRVSAGSKATPCCVSAEKAGGEAQFGAAAEGAAEEEEEPIVCKGCTVGTVRARFGSGAFAFGGGGQGGRFG